MRVDGLDFPDGTRIASADGLGGGGGAAAGGLRLIEEIGLGVDGIITFENIPAGYEDLVIKGMVKTSGGGTGNTALVARVGSGAVDSGAGAYIYSGNYAATTEEGTADLAVIGKVPSAAPAFADYFGPVSILVPGYRDTGRYHAIRAQAGAPNQDLYDGVSDYAAWWLNTTDPIDIVSLAGMSSFSALAAGSKVRLYGVKAADAAPTINTQPGDYTLALADAGGYVHMDAATAQTLTVPDEAAVAFPVGSVVGVYQSGAGALTVAAATGVVVHGIGSLNAQYAEASLRKVATDEWTLVGQVTPA